MVGGTIPPQSDSREISRVLVLNLLWHDKSSGACASPRRTLSLTEPSLLSRATRPHWTIMSLPSHGLLKNKER